VVSAIDRRQLRQPPVLRNPGLPPYLVRIRPHTTRPAPPTGSPSHLEGWWVGGVSGVVEGAFVFDAVGAVLGSGAFSFRHRESAIRARRRVVGELPRAGRLAQLGKNCAPSGWGC